VKRPQKECRGAGARNQEIRRGALINHPRVKKKKVEGKVPIKRKRKSGWGIK